MIRVEIPHDPKSIYCYDVDCSRQKPLDRDFIKDDEFYISLSARLAFWLKDLNIPYKIIEISTKQRSYWFLEFENESDAVLFKLTWSGNQ